jgi:phage protein D/phage baseplate assembly protein gpV
MPPGDRYTRVSILVNGVAVPERVLDDLHDLRVDLALDVPDRATLRFRDDWELKLNNSSAFSLGTAISVALTGDDDELADVFVGEVTELDAEFGDGTAELVVTALEHAHKLNHGNRTTTYLKMTDGDVAKQIAGEYGLTPKVSVTGNRHEYLLQSCTDFQYLHERARAAGARWYVEGEELHFVKDIEAPGATLTWGEQLRSFRARTSVAEGAVDVSVRGWDPKAQRAVSHTQPLADDDLLVDTQLARESITIGKELQGKRFRAESTVTSDAEAEAAAVGLARRAAAEMASARGECIGDPALVPGTRLTIDGIGHRLEGGYVCTSVSHVLSGGRRYVTRFQCGGADQRQLVDLLGGGRRPVNEATASWAERGLVVGIVTNNGDPENLGRVKIKYPTLPTESESDWARVLSVGAGKQRGVRSIPEPNDEVLVAFEHGDARRPVVLGGLWSAEVAPPGEKDTSSRKFFTVRSLRGSELVLEDATGKTNVFRVQLKGNGGLLQVGEEDTKLDSRSPITITGDRDITIKATGKLVIEAQEISMKAQGKVVTEGLSVETKATVGWKAEATTVDLKAKGQTNIEAGAVAQVKGAILKLN